VVSHDVKRSRRVNPQLLTFAILSAVLGFVLRQVIPNPDQFPLHVIAITTIVLWIVFSSVLHALLRIFGGTASFIETLSVTLQVLAVVYVICNLIAFAARVFDRASIVDVSSETIEALAYFPVQFILLAVYMPLAVGPLHTLRGWRLFVPVVMIWVSLFVLVGILFVFVADMPMAMAPPPPP
jgi:hypothetical protein